MICLCLVGGPWNDDVRDLLLETAQGLMHTKDRRARIFNPHLRITAIMEAPHGCRSVGMSTVDTCEGFVFRTGLDMDGSTLRRADILVAPPDRPFLVPDGLSLEELGLREHRASIVVPQDEFWRYSRVCPPTWVQQA